MTKLFAFDVNVGLRRCNRDRMGGGKDYTAIGVSLPTHLVEKNSANGNQWEAKQQRQLVYILPQWFVKSSRPGNIEIKMDTVTVEPCFYGGEKGEKKDTFN